jgi:hypothetical protein
MHQGLASKTKETSTNVHEGFTPPPPSPPTCTYWLMREIQLTICGSKALLLKKLTMIMWVEALTIAMSKSLKLSFVKLITTTHYISLNSRMRNFCKRRLEGIMVISISGSSSQSVD